MSVAQLCNYYPKYSYLDDVLSVTKKNQLNLFIDLKGCMQSLFQEWAVKQIVFQSEGTQVADSSPFLSVLEFISFHKIYCQKRDIPLKMYIFLESGKSSYHKDVHKDYKANRATSDFFGLDDGQRDLFTKVLDKNYQIVSNVGNKIPDVTVIRLKYLEADFVPYYIMKYAIPESVAESTNIVYSTDKDMLQCLYADNIFQFYRHYKKIVMLDQKTAYTHFLKYDPGWDLGIEWFPMVLSIIGDDADGFKGVHGVGLKTIRNVMDEVKILCGGSMQQVYDNIHNKKPIFDTKYDVKSTPLKKILKSEDIVVRNLKLASYQLLCDYVNNGYPLAAAEFKKQMDDTISNTNKMTKAVVLYNALNNAGMGGIISESTISNLFIGHE